MSTANSITIDGKAGEKVTLPKAVFGVKGRPALVAQAVRTHLSNQRSASAKTKTRAEVSKTTAKMYRQKGTGRARHGSYAAPIFVGGGIAFGPDGRQNHKMSLPKSMGRLALLAALNQKAEAKQVFVLTDVNKIKKTSDVKGLSGRKLVVLATDQVKTGVYLRNLDRVNVRIASQINAYHIFSHPTIYFTPEALSELNKKYV
ncbi:MAG: 50S ribosomal protein L4 [Patescibacteria group bacterium]